MFKRSLSVATALAMTILTLTVAGAQSTTTISGLPAVTVPSSGDIFPFDHSGTTSKITLANIFANAPPVTNLLISSAAPVSPASNQVLIGNDAVGGLVVRNGSGSSSMYFQSSTGSANWLQISPGYVQVTAAATNLGAAYNTTGFRMNGASGVFNGMTFQGHSANDTYFGNEGGTTDNLIIAKANEATGTLFTFANTGNFTATGTVTGNGAYINSSDERVKHAIRPIRASYCSAAVMKLRAKEFTLNYSGKRDLGFLAQNIKKIFPELVSVVDKQGHLGLEYSGLIAPLVCTIQQQQEEIAALQRQAHPPATATVSGSVGSRLHWLFFGS